MFCYDYGIFICVPLGTINPSNIRIPSVMLFMFLNFIRLSFS